MSSVKLTVREFPIHDAAIPSALVDSGEDGCLKVRIEVIVNREEPLGVLESLGLKSRHYFLIFEKCCGIESNLLGVYTKSESIDR